jgi:transcription elongation GreA/GreB family factor
MTKQAKLKEKEELLRMAISQLMDRINFAGMAMKSAQEAANDEGKSSVGDKYETSRAMGQIDTEMNARQLDEAQRELSHLQKIITSEINEEVIDGSVVETDSQKFFISTGLGLQPYKKSQIAFISLSSPLGKILNGKKEGEQISFNGKSYSLKSVY